jgi:small subunit ribosomal protein S3
MTHTVHPYAHRLGIIRDWKSRWFAADKKSYRENIRVDEAIRSFLKKRLAGTYTSTIEIERSANELRVVVSTARPGFVIGRSGENAAKLRKELAAVVRKEVPADRRAVKLDIVEIRNPELDASVVGSMVVEGLEKRMPFRRVLKQTAEKVKAVREVEGVRIVISGRLGGADMSRKEEVKRGRIPLQTFRADIDFAHEEAVLPYGVIGVKVWIYKGNVYAQKPARLQ